MAVPGRMSLEDAGRRILGEVEEISLEEVMLRIRGHVGDFGDQYEGSNRADMHRSPHQIGGFAAQSPVKQYRGATAAGLRLLSFHVPELQQVVATHFDATRSPELVVGGSRPLALVYFLVATLITTQRYAVVIVDTEARFEVRRLLGMRPAVHGAVPKSSVCEDDLQHVHVFRTDPRWHTSLRELVATAEQRALYGMQRRRDRPLWGTIAVGSTASGAALPSTIEAVGASFPHGAGAALATGYYGWLRVDALRHHGEQDEQVRQDGKVNHEEFVQTRREQRLTDLFNDIHLGPPELAMCETAALDQVEHVVWVASSPWGGFAFNLSGRSEPYNEMPTVRSAQVYEPRTVL
ncbi:cytochrome c oxidase family protein [Ophiostoma piceae UAMH 11346]|uniref:Cytochrome c oxidase family protein n=1 Tax=Ophiostoma piceae (strain UAMH 11346) TaxID=1262450 RepID=S3C2F1_OPHP1|nr:cytochrome c oxidase family protein [Ophiostoma piceae UAMH 11346]